MNFRESLQLPAESVSIRTLTPREALCDNMCAIVRPVSSSWKEKYSRLMKDSARLRAFLTAENVSLPLRRSRVFLLKVIELRIMRLLYDMAGKNNL